MEKKKETISLFPLGFVEVRQAQSIPDDSWLLRPEHKWFRKGYEYACTQTQALPALSKTDPQTLFHAVTAILRGAGLKVPT